MCKIAAPKYYISNIQRRLDIAEKVIEAKKEHAHDKGKISKVLVTHTIKNAACKIDEQLKHLKLKWF